MLTVAKVSDDTYELQGSNSGKSLAMDSEQYEDLYYAVPEESGKYLNTTSLYRLFTDSIFGVDETRAVFIEILSAEGPQDEALKQLQDEIRKLKP